MGGWTGGWVMIQEQEGHSAVEYCRTERLSAKPAASSLLLQNL